MSDFDRYTLFSEEQHEGAAFLASRRVACLGDKMGFGKTAQFVRACDYVNAQRVTIICPPIARLNELRQFDQWAMFDRPATVIQNGADEVPSDGVIAVSYPVAAQERMRNLLSKRGCDVMIFDEAHRLRNRLGQWTKAAFLKKGYARTAERLWFVSGTMAPNNASEWFVFAQVCGAWKDNYRAFVERFCVYQEGQFGLKIVGNKNTDELLAMLRPYVLARDKVDRDRPPLNCDTIALHVDDAPELKQLDEATAQMIRDAIALGNFDLLQSASVSTERRLIGTAKAKAAADYVVSECEQYQGVLTFALHRDVIDTICASHERAGIPYGRLDGTTKPNDKTKIEDAFQRGELKSLVCHPISAGEVLTLTRADRVVLAESAWNPEINNQAIARAWRRGQTRPVYASTLYLPGTIDEDVNRVVIRKITENAKLKF